MNVFRNLWNVVPSGNATFARIAMVRSNFAVRQDACRMPSVSRALVAPPGRTHRLRARQPPHLRSQ